MTIKSAVYRMFPDEKKGILYCVGGRVFIVDLNSGEKIGSFKSISNPNQVLWNEARDLLIIKSTVGDFTVFQYNNLRNTAQFNMCLVITKTINSNS